MVSPTLSKAATLALASASLTLASTTSTTTHPRNPPDLSTLPTLLQSVSPHVFPPLKALAANIWSHPELGRSEHYAHDLIVNYFAHTCPASDGWTVVPRSSPTLPTSWRLEFENRPRGTDPNKPLPVVGFLAEYDALPGIGHACGHNHIALTGLAAASLVRQAVVDLGVAGRVVVVGTPDEEGEAGKKELLDQGAFDGVDVWLMAHPTNADAIQPMNSRINAVVGFNGARHGEAVRKAYEALVAVRDLAAGGLPGTSSSVNPVEDVGVFGSNVVQGKIELGVNGSTLERVQTTVAGLLDASYPGVSFVVAEDGGVPGGVNLTVLGPGGHASESTKSPLVLTIETFRALQADEGISFYLPGNTTATELDITWDYRTRYTHDLDAVVAAVTPAYQSKAAFIRTDTIYPSLEVMPVLTDLWLDLVKRPEYFGENSDWKLSTFAPASADAAWLQNAVVDSQTHALLGADKVVFHANYGICDPSTTLCAFNHEPKFKDVAGTEYSYGRTEIMARGLAELAVRMLGDSAVMANVTAILDHN